MSRSYDVIVVGDYCLDLIFTGLSKLPELGTEIVGTGFNMIPGGTYNTAIAMHRLGIRVGWAADFGSDEFSRYTLERAAKEGIDPTLFVHHEQPLRRITVAASYPHDRAFIAYYDPDPALPAGLKALSTATARLCYVPAIYAGSSFQAGLLLIRAKKMKLVMDGSSTEKETLEDPSIRKAIEHVDILMPNAGEARHLTGETDLHKAIQTLAGLCPLVVVKDGQNGAFAACKGELYHAPGIPITPVDTTGAGDCFNAGFLKAHLQGLPLRECLRWGNVVGGLSTLEHGGTERVVSEDDVRGWLRRTE